MGTRSGLELKTWAYKGLAFSGLGFGVQGCRAYSVWGLWGFGGLDLGFRVGFMGLLGLVGFRVLRFAIYGSGFVGLRGARQIERIHRALYFYIHTHIHMHTHIYVYIYM